MSGSREFYRRRDIRIRSYMDGDLRIRKPVVVGIGASAMDAEAGQLLVLTLANLLARVHRSIRFYLPRTDGTPLRMAWPPGNGTLEGAILATTKQIDPCGKFSLHEHHGTVDADLGVGVGVDAPRGLPWYVGARGALAVLDREPIGLAVEFGPGTRRGAGLAACLAASVPFQMEHRVVLRPRRVSAWNYRDGDEAELGPTSLDPVDPGRVLMVGAGAVGSSLAYWLRAWGVVGEWTVVDPDPVELHNTSRGLLFTAADAGWPGAEGRSKAELVGELLPGPPPVAEWYRDAVDVHDQTFDVILPLANEQDVRAQLAGRNATVLLHATTGRDWVSQLHRHVKGRDDCIACRMADVVPAAMKCSTVHLEPEESGDPEGDAALPYLSAASGLMLATALQRLCAGVLPESSANDWCWYFKSERAMARRGRRSCRESCTSVRPPEVRALLARDRRWTNLDPVIAERHRC